MASSIVRKLNASSISRLAQAPGGAGSSLASASARWTSTGQSKRLSFDGQTAIVTGAGRGLGKEYALLLASRGANVVVNDFGGSKSGEPAAAGATHQVADQVVQELEALNPDSRGKLLASHEAVSCESSVKRLVDGTLDKFGRIDILINNAGILRDRSFANMTIDDWDQVCNIHLRGSFLVSRACWPVMRKQNYGKIIMTSSTSGLFGNFGQANYASAKMGLIGLCNVLAIEGKKNNIYCNTVVPMAASRMTRDIIPAELARQLQPAYVAPLTVWLCHSNCRETGAIVEAAGQWFGRYKLHRASGKYLPGISAYQQAEALEKLAANWNEICDLDDGQATHVESFADHLSELLRVFDTNSGINK